MFSLAINRRALILSGLVAFGAALSDMVNDLGGGGINTLMLSALILGSGHRAARRRLAQGAALRS